MYCERCKVRPFHAEYKAIHGLNLCHNCVEDYANEEKERQRIANLANEVNRLKKELITLRDYYEGYVKHLIQMFEEERQRLIAQIDVKTNLKIQNDDLLNELTDSAQRLMESNTAIPSEMIDQMKAHQNKVAGEIAVKYEQYNAALQNSRNSDSEQKIDRLSELAKPKLKKKVLVPKAKQNLTMRKLN
jgi:hypothetical protein